LINKANWENIKSDLQKVLEKIQLKNNDTRNTVDTLWNIFKTELITSIESNVPHKIITYRHRLPMDLLQGISQVFYLFWLVCLLFDVGYDHQLCLGVDYVVLVLVFRKRMMEQTNQYDQG
jgi:hypothetical protein